MCKVAAWLVLMCVYYNKFATQLTHLTPQKCSLLSGLNADNSNNVPSAIEAIGTAGWRSVQKLSKLETNYICNLN